jgi:hypothetical protein
VHVPQAGGAAHVNAPPVNGGAAIHTAPVTGNAGVHAPGTGASIGARANVPQINTQAGAGTGGITTGGANVHTPGLNAATGVNAATGINASTAAAANAATSAGARTALRIPTTGTSANVGINQAANFRANWANRTAANLNANTNAAANTKVNTNLTNAVKASVPAAAASTAGTSAGVAANGALAGTTAGTSAATTAATGTNAVVGLSPTRANFWSSLGQGMLNTAVYGNPYGAYGLYGGYGAGGMGYYPFIGNNFWSGRNLMGLGVSAATGSPYGYSWWGYSPWMGGSPAGYWYGNPGFGMFANSYGWNSPFFYDYGTNGNVVYTGNQVLVNDQPVGTPQEYAQSAAELATITPEQMNAPHEWAPLGTFAVALGQDDKNPVRIAQLAHDNKQGLISGTIFNKQSGNLYTLQGKVDPQTQRVAFTIGNDPNTVFETGLYNLTQEATPVLVHFGPSKTSTYVFARVPEPKEGEQQQTTTATAGANAATPPATEVRR